MNTLELIDSRLSILKKEREETVQKRKKVRKGGGITLVVFGILFLLLGLAAIASGFLLFLGVETLAFLLVLLAFWIYLIIGGGVALILGIIFLASGAHVLKKKKNARRAYDEQIASLDTRIKAYEKQRGLAVDSRHKRNVAHQRVKQLRKLYLAGKIGPKEYLRRKEALLAE